MKIVTLVNNSMAFDVRVQRHARALAEAGHDVTSIGVLTKRDRDRPSLPAVRGLRYVWADRRRHASIGGRWGWFASRAFHSASATAWRRGLTIDAVAHRIVAPTYSLLLNKALQQDADVFYANDIDTLPVAAVAAQKKGAALIYDAHEFYLGESRMIDPRLVAAQKRVEGVGLTRSRGRITVSGAIAEKLSSIYGCACPTVVRNLPEIASDIRVSPVPSCGQPVRVLYHTGNLALNGRSVKDLIDAVEGLGGQVFLTLRGYVRPSREPELLSYLRERLRPGSWAVLPVVSYRELVAEASQHDIGVVLNSTANANEELTLPNKPFEYMMAGLALLSYRTVGMMEVFHDDRLGLVTPENTVDALVASLTALVGDRSRLMRMKETARQAALETYNWASEKSKLLGVIDAATAHTPTQRRAT